MEAVQSVTWFRKDRDENVNRHIAGSCSFAEMHHDRTCSAVYVWHDPHLMATLVNVVLFDAHSINPHGPRPVGITQIPDGDEAIPCNCEFVDWATVSADDLDPQCFVFAAPGVRESLVSRGCCRNACEIYGIGLAVICLRVQLSGSVFRLNTIVACIDTSAAPKQSM